MTGFFNFNLQGFSHGFIMCIHQQSQLHPQVQDLGCAVPVIRYYKWISYDIILHYIHIYIYYTYIYIIHIYIYIYIYTYTYYIYICIGTQGLYHLISPFFWYFTMALQVVRALCALDGSRVAAGSNDGFVRLWDSSGKMLAERQVAQPPGDGTGVTRGCTM